jgi:regulator of replication initiation timing
MFNMQCMKLNKELSEMTIEDLRKLVTQLLEENRKLKEELGRTKKSQPSQR